MLEVQPYAGGTDAADSYKIILSFCVNIKTIVKETLPPSFYLNKD